MIRTPSATVTYYPQGCYTTYADGASYAAQPHDTPDYRLIASRLGYGSDTMRFCRHHDAMHVIAADWFGYVGTDVLWKLAHGEEPNPIAAAREEAFVQMLQAWVERGERPVIGGVDWAGFRAHALALLGEA